MGHTDLNLADKILNKLLKLNLCEEPQDELTEIIKEYDFRKIMSLQKIPKGTLIYRTRPNNGSELFVTPSQLSYPPKKNCNHYQRANIKGQPMFYGSIDEKGDTTKNDIYSCVAGMIFESSNQIRNNTSDIKQAITCGIWEVTKEIALFSFPYHKEAFLTASKRISELHKEDMHNLNKRNGYNTLNNTLLNFITEKISSSFANELDYFIVANIIHYILCRYKDRGLNGILYLSTAMSGLTTNVALTPEAVDNNLRFKGAEIHLFGRKDGDVELLHAFDGYLNNDNIEYQITEYYLETYLNSYLNSYQK